MSKQKIPADVVAREGQSRGPTDEVKAAGSSVKNTPQFNARQAECFRQR